MSYKDLIPKVVHTDQYEAREWLKHPSQQAMGISSDSEFPEEFVKFYKCGGIIGLCHPFQWPDVWSVHCIVNPEEWGRIVDPAKAMLHVAWKEHKPEAFVALTQETNRATLAFNRRLGFVQHGKLPLSTGVVFQSWRIECQQ